MSELGPLLPTIATTMSLALDVATPGTVGWPLPAPVSFGRPVLGSNGVDHPPIPEKPTAIMLL